MKGNLVDSVVRILCWVLLILAAILLPLFVSFVPLPLSPYYTTALTSQLASGFVLGWILLNFLVYWLGRKASSRIILWVLRAGIVLSVLFAAASLFVMSSLTLFYVFAACAAFTCLLCCFCWDSPVLAARGVATLLLFFCFILLVEKTLQCLPNDIGVRQILFPPSLVESNPVVEKSLKEFRFSAENRFETGVVQPNILFLGGAAFSGLNGSSAAAGFEDLLVETLRERIPEKRYQVFSAIEKEASFVQLLSAYEELFYQLKPEIVIVGGWFADSLEESSWDVRGGLSDWEFYRKRKVLSCLKNSRIYSWLREKRLFLFLRYYLLGVLELLGESKNPSHVSPAPRVNPRDYQRALEKFAALSRKEGFKLIFLLEPLNRSGALAQMRPQNQYYKVTSKVAAVHRIPLLDAPSVVAHAEDAWLFYTPSVLSRDGQSLIAEELAKLIRREFHRSNLSEDDSRTILGRAEAGYEVRLQYERNALRASGLSLVARAPFLDEGSGELELVWDEKEPRHLQGLTSDFSKFSLPGAMFEGSAPIVDIVLRARIYAGNERLLGQSGIRTSVYFSALSGGKFSGEEMGLWIGCRRIDKDISGYNLAAFGARSGNVLYRNSFPITGPEALEHMAAFVLSLADDKAEKQVVMVSVKTSGGSPKPDGVVAKAMRHLGGSGRLPAPFESFVLVGSPGLPPGTALEKIGRGKLSVDLGDNPTRKSWFIEVAPDSSICSD